MDNIKELILAVRQGKGDAFVRIEEQYSPLLHSMSRKYSTMCQDSGEDDDFLQEAKRALYKATLSFKIDSTDVTFGAYAKRCVRNRLVSYVRKLKSKKHAQGTDAQLSGDEEDYVESPISDMLDKELLLQAQNLLSNLEKQIFTLYLDGMKTKEISKKLGKNKRTVDNAIYRVRVKIKRMVNEAT